jgi:hypothetical protein
VIWKEWILDILLAGLLGILAYRISRSKVAVWIWILPMVWFGLRLLSLVPTLGGRGQPGLWYEVSGEDCVHGMTDMGCANFFLFTIPFIRSLAYSFGTLIGMGPPTAQFAKGEGRRANCEKRIAKSEPTADG